MSAAEFSRFDELVSCYLDEALTDGDAAELVTLLAEPPLAARFLEMTRLNSEIAGVLAAPVPDAAMVELVRTDIQKSRMSAKSSDGTHLRIVKRTQPQMASPAAESMKRSAWSRSKPVRPALAWAAVFLILAALAGIHFSGLSRPAAKIEVTAVQGEVYFIDESGRTRLTGKLSLSKAGKLKTVGAASFATILLGDGTRVDIGGNSAVATHSGSASHRLYLEDGSLRSQIVKQRPNRPLVFATAEAEATVKGTALSLETRRHHTRLVVTEGQVLLKRKLDGAEVTVKTGYYAVVTPNAPLVATPLHPEPHAVR